MVPVIWAFFSADVNAGTARAARIAIIAITTSSSISVNADQNFFTLIFIFGFLSCSCSEGFWSQRVWFSDCSAFAQGFGGAVFWGFGVSVVWLVCSQRFGLRMRGLSQSSQMKSTII